MAARVRAVETAATTARSVLRTLGVGHSTSVREPYTQLYVHLVWATWERQPLITSALQQIVYAGIRCECKALKADVVALGGMPDHVHLLVRLPAAVAVAALVKQVKGSTSHLMSHGLDERVGFKWQGGYGAFTVAKRDLATVRGYIERQEQHHTLGHLWPGAERTEP